MRDSILVILVIKKSNKSAAYFKFRYYNTNSSSHKKLPIHLKPYISSLNCFKQWGHQRGVQRTAPAYAPASNFATDENKETEHYWVLPLFYKDSTV